MTIEIYMYSESAKCRLTYWTKTHATVSDLHSKIRRDGHATGLMSDVCQLADLHKTTLVLAAEPFGDCKDEPSTKDLVAFYKRFDFKRVEKKAKKSVFMIRFPH